MRGPAIVKYPLILAGITRRPRLEGTPRTVAVAFHVDYSAAEAAALEVPGRVVSPRFSISAFQILIGHG